MFIALHYDVIESDHLRRRNVNFRSSLRLCLHQYYVYVKKTNKQANKTPDRSEYSGHNKSNRPNAKIQWLLMESNIIKKSRNIFTLKEDFRISCYDMCSSLLSLKDIERQPQRTKKADHTSSGRNEVLIEEGMKFL